MTDKPLETLPSTVTVMKWRTAHVVCDTIQETLAVTEDCLNDGWKVLAINVFDMDESREIWLGRMEEVDGVFE